MFEPQLLERVRELPHIWATNDPEQVFMRMNEYYKDDPNWTFTGMQRSKLPERDKTWSEIGTSIWRFGFRRRRKEMGREYGNGTGDHRSYSSQIHFLMDMRGFLSREELDTLHVPTWILFERAKEIRNFLYEMGIGPRYNFAGIASSLLRHPRFYPYPRKRVPIWLNEKARPYLPGNHYDVMTRTGTVIKQASYHDQRSAHHYAAMNVDMPTSDSLAGKGFTRSEDRIWITPKNPQWKRLTSEYGLFMMRVRVPAHEEYELRFLPHGFRTQGIHTLPVWSSEIAWLEELGVKFLGCLWALTGTEVDEGIKRYAEWAYEESQRSPYLKRTLLAAYGILGSRPSHQANLKQGDDIEVHWDRYKFKASSSEWSDYRSPGVTNVIQRGIIEAYTRMLTLRYSSSLPRHTQLAIYGDAVIIDGKIIAPIPEPWREKGELTNLIFRNAVQFTSDQMSRLPGIKQ